MNYSSLSASDLLKHRSHHVDSLTRLRRARSGTRTLLDARKSR
ncbi:hypothetical protein [Pseudomonas aeruginosa]|nr:hypothetical protein [Pseudomonas aeruginosa]